MYLESQGARRRSHSRSRGRWEGSCLEAWAQETIWSSACSPEEGGHALRGWHLHWRSGVWGKHGGHIPLNGSSDSQVTGRGGCGRGLLGHACACARVLTCMLGCLSNLAVVGLRRKHSLFAVARTRGSSLPHSQSPAPSFPCPVASRLREKHCIRLRASGTSLQLRRKSWAGLWREVQV